MIIKDLFLNSIEIFATELFLTIVIFSLLLFTTILIKHKKDQIIEPLNNLTYYTIFLIGLILINTPVLSTSFCNGLIIFDFLIKIIKFFLIFSTFCLFTIHKDYIINQKIYTFEVYILILMSLLGLLLLSSAYNFLIFYLALELQSLSFYILASSKKRSNLSSEAGLKYFILGAIASSFLLLGMSIIYGVLGSLDYGIILNLITNLDSYNSVILYPLIFGLFLILSCLLFKIGSVPFHTWLPDVYEGSPNSITAFFIIVPKIALMAVMLRLFFDIFNPISVYFESIFYICAIASITLGLLASIQQYKIKRLLAYSSITHTGFILIAFTVQTINSLQSICFYIIIYILMNINLWACLLSILVNNKPIKYITDLSIIFKTNKPLALSLVLTLFSMAGIPPLSGFYSKLYIFLSAIEESFYGLSVIGIILSGISAFYYIRLIKILMFDNKQFIITPILNQISKSQSFIISINTHFLLLFFIFPDYLLTLVKKMTLYFIF